MCHRLALLFALALPLVLASPSSVLGAEQRSNDSESTAQGTSQDEADSSPQSEKEEEFPQKGFQQTLVVTATRIEVPILESPVAITVLDERHLKNASSENFSDLLRSVPGLNGIQLTARDSQFSARTATGVMSNRMLTLVDGRSVYLGHQGIVMYDGLSFGVDELRQIEILKGPGSSMWGANALAGVINFRTKTPREIAGGLFELEGGENGYQRFGIRWAAAVSDRIGYKLSASYLEQDAWPRDPLMVDGTPIPPEFQYQNEGTAQPKLDFRLDHQTGEHTTWSYRAGYSGVEGMILSGLGPLSLQDNFYHAFGEVRRTSENLEVVAYWNRMQGDSLNLISGDTLNSKTDTFVGELTGHPKIRGRHRLVYGLNARHSDFDLSWTASSDSRNEFGAFLEDEIRLGNGFKLSLGARIDHFDTIGTAASPRATLFFAPRWNHVFRLTYNNAYRAPTHIENYMDVFTSNPVVLHPALPLFDLKVRGLGSDDLDEEQIDSLEIGYSAVLAGRHELSVALYRNEIEDSIEFATTEFYGPGDPPPGWPFPPQLTPPFPKVFSPFNAGTVTEEGVEFSLTTDWNPNWRTIVSYSYQDDPEIQATAAPFPVALNTPPNHQAAITVQGQRESWSGAASVTYTDDAFWRDVLDQRFWGATDDYYLVQASVTREFSQLFAVTVRGTNLLDEETKQHVYGDLIGRQVTARLRFRWQ